MSDEYFVSLLVQFFYVLTFCNSKMSHWFSQNLPTKNVKMTFCLTILKWALSHNVYPQKEAFL